VPQANSLKWWDMKALKYLDKGDDRDRPDEFTAAAKLLTGSVVEIGCCFGNFCNYLPQNQHYTGLDHSEFMIEIARERHPERDFYCLDVINPQFILNKDFDWGVCMQTLEHFTAIDDMMKAIKSMTRKGLVFTVPMGIQSVTAVRNDGHINEWATEADFLSDFGRFGIVERWKGRPDHWCGVLKWND